MGAAVHHRIAGADGHLSALVDSLNGHLPYQKGEEFLPRGSQPELAEFGLLQLPLTSLHNFLFDLIDTLLNFRTTAGSESLALNIVPLDIGKAAAQFFINNTGPPPRRATALIDSGPSKPSRDHHRRQNPGFPLAAGRNQTCGAHKKRQGDPVMDTPEVSSGGNQSCQHQCHFLPLKNLHLIA